MDPVRPKVLVVEDDADSREILAELLASDFDVDTAENGETGWDAFERLHPDVVVTDETLPDGLGSQLARRVKEADPDAVVVLVSGHTNLEGTPYCDAVLRKPFDIEQLSRTMSDVFDRGLH
jgi:DNA-binding NtrC family response regulator